MGNKSRRGSVSRGLGQNFSSVAKGALEAVSEKPGIGDASKHSMKPGIGDASKPTIKSNKS